MDLSNDLLRAFLTVHEQTSFTKAGKALMLSQSAISQKIARLEESLRVSLFVRGSEGLKLTSSGEKLLPFARQQLQMQESFLAQFDQDQVDLHGNYRLAGFSSVVRSVLIPSLSGFLRNNPGVNIEFSSHEVVDLLDVLKRNKADAVITDYLPDLPGVETLQLGWEEYVLIESRKHNKIPDVYLDHGPHDNATESFFKFQGRKSSFRRGFMGDVYGILDAVKLGLGKAVMSKHLVAKDKEFKVIKCKKKYKRPIILCYLRQSYYSPIHAAIEDELIKKSSLYL